MTDERRAKLDQDVEEFTKACNDKIKLLQTEIWQGTKSVQAIEHRKAMIEIMLRMFNDFVKCSTLLRTTRMMRDLEREKFDRIQIVKKKRTAKDNLESISSEDLSIDKLKELTQSDDTTVNTSYHSQSNLTLDDCEQQASLAAAHEIPISPQEIRTLAMENSLIHDELVTLNDEIQLIGKKVVQISKLQELFSDKVMEQEIELNTVHETAIRSSENVREGNDMIKEAMMKNASTRVFILFYIITLTFTILFLDWYNP